MRTKYLRQLNGSENIGTYVHLYQPDRSCMHGYPQKVAHAHTDSATDSDWTFVDTWVSDLYVATDSRPTLL